MPIVRRRRVVQRKKRSVPRGVMMKRRGGVGRANIRRTSDYAKLVEIKEYPINMALDAGGNIVFADTFTTTLGEFQRGMEVAHAYKYYRCAKIELEFVPYANVASVNGAPALRIPQLYFTVDRVANHYILPSEEELQSRGVSPKVFNRKYRFSWKPNLLQNVQLETHTLGIDPTSDITNINAVNSVPLFNKWLPTQQSWGYASPVRPSIGPGNMVQPSANPYNLRYYGATYVIDQEGGTTPFTCGDLLVKVTWEFKSPRAIKTEAPAAQMPVGYNTSMTNPAVTQANAQPTVYP